MLPPLADSTTPDCVRSHPSLVTVKIPTLDGHLYEVYAHSNDTIATIKDKVAEEMQSTSEIFKLLHNNSPLVPDKKLKDYGFKNGDTARLYLVLKIGPCHICRPERCWH